MKTIASTRHDCWYSLQRATSPLIFPAILERCSAAPTSVLPVDERWHTGPLERRLAQIRLLGFPGATIEQGGPLAEAVRGGGGAISDDLHMGPLSGASLLRRLWKRRSSPGRSAARHQQQALQAGYHALFDRIAAALGQAGRDSPEGINPACGRIMFR